MVLEMKPRASVVHVCRLRAEMRGNIIGCWQPQSSLSVPASDSWSGATGRWRGR